MQQKWPTTTPPFAPTRGQPVEISECCCCSVCFIGNGTTGPPRLDAGRLGFRSSARPCRLPSRSVEGQARSSDGAQLLREGCTPKAPVPLLHRPTAWCQGVRTCRRPSDPPGPGPGRRRGALVGRVPQSSTSGPSSVHLSPVWVSPLRQGSPTLFGADHRHPKRSSPQAAQAMVRQPATGVSPRRRWTMTPNRPTLWSGRPALPNESGSGVTEGPIDCRIPDDA